MVELTGAQQGLVIAHLRLAAMIAQTWRSRLMTRDEKFSSACYGMCLAARKVTDPAAVERMDLYLGKAANRQVGTDLRTRRRRYAEQWPDGLEPPVAGPHEDVDDREEFATLVLSRLGSLPGREREAILLYAGGSNWREVAAAMGMRRKSMERLGRRAIARLKVRPPPLPFSHNLMPS